MVAREKTKRQTLIYKTLHRKLKIKIIILVNKQFPCSTCSMLPIEISVVVFALSRNINMYYDIYLLFLWVRVKVKVKVMVFSATFNNNSAISWLSILLVEETGLPGENHRPAASHWQTLSHNAVSSTPRLNGVWTHNVCFCECCVIYCYTI